MSAADEFRSLSEDELEEEIEASKQELLNLRFSKVVGQLEDTNRPRAVRRRVARLKTVQRERQLAAQLLAEEGEDG